MNIYLLQNEERRGIKETLVFEMQKKKEEERKEYVLFTIKTVFICRYIIVLQVKTYLLNTNYIINNHKYNPVPILNNI